LGRRASWGGSTRKRNGGGGVGVNSVERRACYAVADGVRTLSEVRDCYSIITCSSPLRGRSSLPVPPFHRFPSRHPHHCAPFPASLLHLSSSFLTSPPLFHLSLSPLSRSCCSCWCPWSSSAGGVAFPWRAGGREKKNVEGGVFFSFPVVSLITQREW
ncbi:hypothetical protein Taro_034741, partial [Colocasia esculenta]|nr:hypothetical protein [Colocasia esculenta]